MHRLCLFALVLLILSAFTLLSPSDAGATSLFDDEFNGSQGTGWTCTAPKTGSACAVSSSALELSVARGADQWVRRDNGTRFLRSPGAAEWSIETSIVGFTGNSGNTFAGLVVYSSVQDLLAWGWLNDASLQAWQVVKNTATNNTAVMATRYSFLRIRKASSAGAGYYSYYFDASMDGVNWTNGGVFRDTAGRFSGSSVSVGFLGKDWNPGSGRDYAISFDYFRVNPDNEMPLAEDLPVANTSRLGQETGATQAFAGTPLVNNSFAAAGVCGADLGVMFDWNARTYFAFGDTTVASANSCRKTSNIHNSLAWTDGDADLGNGVSFDGWMTDSATGKAKGLFDPDGAATAAIPTGAIANGSTAYIFYMNVTQWTRPGGTWTCDHASIATATQPDAWTKQYPSLSWQAGNFNQLAPVRAQEDSGMIYIFGIPCGRYGSVELMRVAEADILNKSAYQYFAGFSGSTPQWASDEAAAVTVAGGPVGELSVRYITVSGAGKYIMTYLDQLKQGIVLREAPQPYGPWGAPRLIARDAQYSQLYGPFMKAGFDGVDADGKTYFYYTMSQFGPYNVFWMRTKLP